MKYIFFLLRCIVFNDISLSDKIFSSVRVIFGHIVIPKLQWLGIFPQPIL